MVEFQVEWDEEALDVFKAIFQWYKKNLGQKAADKFRNGILNAVRVLQSNPQLGKVEELLVGREKQYRSLLEYPHHRIIYFIEDSVIYIAYIWDNRMNSKMIPIVVK